MSNPWITPVSGGFGRSVDVAEVRRALGVLMDPGACHEVCGLTHLEGGRAKVDSRLVRGSDLDEAVQIVESLSHHKGLYYTLNPVRPDLGDARAKVGDVVRRAWFLVDCDRSKGIEPDSMATDEEKAKACDLGARVVGYLTDLGWPLPVGVDSGNGEHLLYRIDLPANDHARILISRALKSLQAWWVREWGKSGGPFIDCKVFDASRIAKLPGTWVRKGPDVPTRPHRLARLLFVPDPVEIVPIELLEPLAGLAPAVARGIPVSTEMDAWLTSVVNTGTSVEQRVIAYLAKCDPAVSGSGGHDKTFGVACKIGPGFDLSELEAMRMIREHYNPRCVPPWSDRELEHKVSDAYQVETRRGWLRDTPHKNGAVPHASVPGDRLIILASEVTPRVVEWLIPDRIPIGKLTTFAGAGGLGKSFVTMDLAARISRGDEIPGMKGECFEIGSVLILNTEDDPDDTSVPRLIEAKADLTRIAFAKSEILGRFTLRDLKILDAMVTQLGDVRLIVIDPATAHLGGANDHKNAELRALLMPLSLWAMVRRIAVILVTHVSKPQASNMEAITRVVGSVAWVNAVRAAVIFAKDPEDPTARLFIPIKANNAPEKRGLSYRVVPTEALARIEWLGEVETSADEAMNAAGKTPKKRVGESVWEWFEDRFREQREWRSSELKTLGLAAGFSFDALTKSREVGMLPVRKRPRYEPDGEKYFVWIAEPGWPSETQIESSESSESYSASPCGITDSLLSGQTFGMRSEGEGNRKLGADSVGVLSEDSNPTFGTESKIEGKTESKKFVSPQGLTEQLSELSELSEGGDSPARAREDWIGSIDPTKLPEDWKYFTGGGRIK